MSEVRGSESLWDRLCRIPDRRGRKGRQYTLPPVLMLALSACPEALFLLKLERAPCHATYHRFFKALDAVERVLGAWVREHGPGDHLALDGKHLRGSAPSGHDGREGVHLVSAFASRLLGMAGQLRVPPDRGEITAALALLKGLPLAGTVVTGDAAFCQRAVCQTIRDRNGAYLSAVKADQPKLMADIATAFGDPFPLGTHPRAPAGADAA